MSITPVLSSFARRTTPILRSLNNAYQNPKLACQTRSYSLAIEPAPPLLKIDLSLPSLWSEFTLLIKRTFQPSIIRKRRKTGFLTRQKTVGGRRVLKNRLKKGRARLGGC